ncbi:hypothetical protein PMZ80_000247 [Knufia obscura]|uniref:Uncharacterized protein n=2 Tax=Knufia TaxID=430999 RepID=A0AAN8IBB9_9EURO|nr:hypothetical protein PMZ80_000247 [Knufia obscura]KAK5956825.1 hypothetical protein OHC33_002313 [Knufia fluminis]
MLLSLSKASLLALTLLGGWCLHGFFTTNGFYETITRLTEQKLLPNGVSYHNVFTGIRPLDDMLSILLTFFWPVVDGEHPDSSLISILFAGQAVAAWTLTMLEGLRKGNSWRAISLYEFLLPVSFQILTADSTTVYGLLIQSCGMALTSPAYLLLHLYTSGTITSPSPSDLEIPESALRALPYSISLGFIAPTIAMSLPSPAYLTHQQKIYAVLIWQLFPLWTQLIQSILQNTVFASTSTSTSPKRQIKSLRRVYKFALYLSTHCHIAAGSFSAATVLFPGLFSAHAREQLAPLHIFVPPNPFMASTKVSGLAEGAFWFLQFDLLISGVAYWVWGLTVKYSDARTRRQSGLGDILGDLLVRPSLVGHMACALTYVWERDGAVFGGTAEEGDKKRR